ncbi:MAG: MATE family efflux transporter [Bacteroidetes bacterium 4484_276]|nr:MAG: MATE family efflux transporter [Bacteroidetes bacterium 4484_276]
MKQIFKDIKEAIAGTDQDFTEGKLGRAIFLLSIPMVLEMVMESIFAVVDIYFVSRLGADAIATVGITESLITLIYAVAIGLSMATAALVARRIGEKKHETAANAAFQGIFAGFLISLIIAVPGAIFAPDLLLLMGLSTEVAEGLSSYTAIMIGGNMVIMLLFIINAVFRSAGDAAISMRVLWLANSINLVLDPILIFGWGPFPELGIAGAAIATNIGRGIAVAYQLHLLFRGNGRVKLIGDKIKVDLTVMTKLIRISLGGIGQNIIAMSSWIAMVRIVSVFGSEVVAGYTIAVRIIIFSLLPSWGIGNAAATLVGQNLGAKKPDRAEKSVWMTGRVNLILLGSIGAIFVLIPEFFVRLFIADPAVLIPGAQCLRIISIGFLAYGFGMVLIQSFNGAGDTRTPTWINFICFWVIEIPLAYWLAISVGIGEQGVFYAIVIAETILTVLAFIVFKKGRWKENKV